MLCGACKESDVPSVRLSIPSRDRQSIRFAWKTSRLTLGTSQTFFSLGRSITCATMLLTAPPFNFRSARWLSLISSLSGGRAVFVSLADLPVHFATLTLRRQREKAGKSLAEIGWLVSLVSFVPPRFPPSCPVSVLLLGWLKSRRAKLVCRIPSLLSPLPQMQ